MNRKLLAGSLGMGLILAAAFGIYFMSLSDDKVNPSDKKANLLKVVTVDEIVRHPERFSSSIGVVGTVIKVDESKALFALGCEDACVMMPVRFRGQMPNPDSNIIVYGEITGAEGGRYLFEAQEVKAK